MISLSQLRQTSIKFRTLSWVNKINFNPGNYNRWRPSFLVCLHFRLTCTHNSPWGKIAKYCCFVRLVLDLHCYTNSHVIWKDKKLLILDFKKKNDFMLDYFLHPCWRYCVLHVKDKAVLKNWEGLRVQKMTGFANISKEE